MPSPLVECIPNFSEARRPEVVDAILQSITAVPGVILLDRHSDMDHNRTVVTYLGSPETVEEAAFQAIEEAKLSAKDRSETEKHIADCKEKLPFTFAELLKEGKKR